jgi:hypothetical protein
MAVSGMAGGLTKPGLCFRGGVVEEEEEEEEEVVVVVVVMDEVMLFVAKIAS